MGVIISIGCGKGGVGKTTTAAILSHILSKESRVLAVDFDSQGNLTQMLTNENLSHFTKRTVLEACQSNNPIQYVYKINENLSILPADDMLATFPTWANEQQNVKSTEILKRTLSRIKGLYDYVLIDLPPNLGEHTINGLCASDYAIAMLQSEPFCYDALERYIETLLLVKEKANPSLVLGGILTTMLDARTIIDNAIIEKARSEYDVAVFDTTIRRRNRIKEFSLTGVREENKSDTMALKYYYKFTEELKTRVI